MPKKKFTTLCFLMFDHIAGVDTYFYSLFSGGTAVFPTSRNTGYICRLIEKYKIEVLPTSPTFLNLLLLSEDYKKYNLSSLKVITFGSEKISDHILNNIIYPSMYYQGFWVFKIIVSHSRRFFHQRQDVSTGF